MPRHPRMSAITHQTCIKMRETQDDVESDAALVDYAATIERLGSKVL